MKKIKQAIIFIIALIVTWYIAEGIWWLAVLLKPMTELGILMERIFIHIAFFILALYTTLFFSE